MEVEKGEREGEGRREWSRKLGERVKEKRGMKNTREKQHISCSDD